MPPAPHPRLLHLHLALAAACAWMGAGSRIARGAGVRHLAPKAQGNKTGESECPKLVEDFRAKHAEIRECIGSPTCQEAKEQNLELEIEQLAEPVMEKGCVDTDVTCDMLTEEKVANYDALSHCMKENEEHCSGANIKFLCESIEVVGGLMETKECGGDGGGRAVRSLCKKGRGKPSSK